MTKLDSDKNNYTYNHSGHYSIRASAYFLAACNLEHQDKTLSEEIGFFAEGYFKYVYDYLFAFSLELILKTIVFANSITEETNTYTIIEPDHLSLKLVNAVNDIANKNNFALSYLEDSFREKLREIISWAGRFPFPRQEEKIKQVLPDIFSTKYKLTETEIMQVKNLYDEYSTFYKHIEKEAIKILRERYSEK